MIEVKKYEYQGRLCTVAELSQICGLSTNVVRGRLYKGHTVEEAMAPIIKKKISKNEAELYLNDIPRDQLPKVLLECMKRKICKSKRPGNWFRDEFRAEFDKWFEEEYVPANS